MSVWLDPREAAPSLWQGKRRGETPDRSVADAESMAPTTERAHRTATPFRYRETVRVGGALESEAGPRDYDRAAIHFDGGVTEAGQVKLVAFGYLWDGLLPDQRFRAQYRREAPPTDTVPFDAYTVWRRYQYGEVTGAPGDVELVPDCPVRTLDSKPVKWTAIPGPIRLRLAELELVRNPPLARYVLRELGVWGAVDGYFRWDPRAFASRETSG